MVKEAAIHRSNLPLSRRLRERLIASGFNVLYAS
jgi:hypothetical protein